MNVRHAESFWWQGPKSARKSVRARRLPRAAALSTTVILGLIVVVVAGAPLFAPYDPDAIDPAGRLQGPSASHWAGTDELGRDLMSRLLYGGRVSLAVGFVSTAMAMAAGIPAGLWAGYGETLMGSIILRATDVLLAFPPFLLAMLTATIFRAGFVNLSVAIAVVSVAPFVRLARAAMLRERRLEYVEAARALGCSDIYIIFRSVLRNSVTPLAVQAAFTTANAIVLEAGLSFLGLGTQPPTPSWGLMLQVAKRYLNEDPWYGLFPGLLLLLVVLMLNAAADSVPMLLDSRIRG